MSNFTDPNDPNVVVPGTAEPVREYVVREETVRRVAPAPVVEVEPERSSLRWLWWLLGLLALAALAWALTRACNRTESCTTLPSTVWTTAVQDTAVNEVEQWIPGVAANHHSEVVTALQTLCHARLANATGWHNNNAIQTAFNAFAPNLEASVITNIQNLVNGNSFCRCS